MASRLSNVRVTLRLRVPAWALFSVFSLCAVIRSSVPGSGREVCVLCGVGRCLSAFIHSLRCFFIFRRYLSFLSRSASLSCEQSHNLHTASPSGQPSATAVAPHTDTPQLAGCCCSLHTSLRYSGNGESWHARSSAGPAPAPATGELKLLFTLLAQLSFAK